MASVSLKLIWLSLLLAVPLAPAAVRAAIFQWTDAQGQVHYSQEPPPGTKARQIKGARPAPPPAQPPAAGEGGQAGAGKAPAGKPAGKKPPVDPQRQAQRARNCRLARRNLQAFQAPGRRRYRMPDGSMHYLTAEQLQARIREARDQIRRNCGPDQGS